MSIALIVNGTPYQNRFLKEEEFHYLYDDVIHIRMLDQYDLTTYDTVLLSCRLDVTLLKRFQSKFLSALNAGRRIIIFGEVLDNFMPSVAWEDSEVNIEELMKVDPQIYFENSSDEKTLEKVAEAGIPTVGLQTIQVADADPLATFNSWLEITSDIKGGEVTERADRFIEEGEKVQTMIDEGLTGVEDTEKPRVMFLHQHSDKSIIVGGANFFSEKWIKATGGKDIVGDDGVEGQKEVNMEQIYAWNPDIIYITNFTETQPDDLLNNSVSGQDWSEVQAVKDGNVHKVPLGIYRWFPPNGDAPLMLKWMAQINHPEVFDYDINKEIKNYYSDFYEYELTDEDVDSILHPSSDAAKY